MEAFRLLIVTGMSGAGKTQVLQVENVQTV